MPSPRVSASYRCAVNEDGRHRPWLNPRRAAWCSSCGDRILDPPKRDLDYEHQFIVEVSREAERRFGVDASAYPAAVKDRLDEGARRYTDLGFLDPNRNNLKELREETPDVCVYSVLELERQIIEHGEVAPGVAHHLYEASVHAAAADFHAREARRLRDEWRKANDRSSQPAARAR